MLIFFSENGGTILVGAVLLGIITAITMIIMKDKRKGKILGCGCGECPHSKNCHAK